MKPKCCACGKRGTFFPWALLKSWCPICYAFLVGEFREGAERAMREADVRAATGLPPFPRLT